jgi:iron complex outermembrane receptor protein
LRLQTTRGRLLASTMICSAAIAAMAAAAPAYAQDDSTEVEAVIVTGSRIARQDFVANSPVSTVTAETIEATGSLRTEEILNTLPQVVPGFTAASNNPSDGTSTVDLRGIGPQRTLVLVNGRRTTPATKAFSSTDLNTIPAGLIERVEVVTGGASAVYGSDALAGVVNFILKKDFEGFELGTQYGISERGDGEQFDLNLLAGANTGDGKGNVTAYLSYYDRNKILPSDDRSWSQIALFNGSATGRARFDNVATNPFPAISNAAAYNNCSGTNRSITFNRSGADPLNNSVRGYCAGDIADGVASDRYNFAPVNNLLSPAERLTLNLLGRYDLTDQLEATFEAFYVDNRNGSQLAPTPGTSIVIAADNPFITSNPALAAVVAGRPDPTANLSFRRRMEEVGARQQDHSNKLYQFNFGLNADLGDWKAEAYVSYGRTEFTDTTRNDVSKSRLYASQSGTTTSCSAAVLALLPDCVPMNLFGYQNLTEEQASFIRLNFTDQTVFERYTIAGNVSGPLFKLPAGDLSVAFGFEYREDSFGYTPDAAHASGDIFGFNQEVGVTGGYNVGEIYGEALVPLVADVTGFKYLGLELGIRWSDYSSVGSVLSYKAGIEYEPVDGIRFRGMYQRASRAPNVFELFQAGDQGFPPYADPCATRFTDAPTDPADYLSGTLLAMCTAQLGFSPNTPDGWAQPNAQVEGFFYGNPNLSEEVSDTYTVGVVWQPDFVPGLNVTLDYYNIKVEDYIGSINGGAQGTIDACYDSGSFASDACNDPRIGALVYRDSTGELKVRVPLGNVSELKTSGVDFSASYGIGMGWTGGGIWGDTLDAKLLLTYLDSYELDGIEYAGTIGAYNISATLPEWKASLQLGYDVGPVRINYIGTYLTDMDNQGNIPEFQDGGYPGVDAYWYHDVNARWAVNDMVEVFGGIKNLADEEPPVFENANDGNTDPNSYDVIGRYFYAGAKLKF